MNTSVKDFRKIAIIKAPGTNCDLETEFSLKKSGYNVTIVKLKDMIYSTNLLSEFRGIILPGGFTYGDYIESGVIFSYLVKSKLIHKFYDFLDNKGKILGICNGFQILVRLGLLPFPKESVSISLENNQNNRFECRWVPIINHIGKISNFSKVPKQIFLPVAHLEGRLIFKNKEIYDRLKENNQIIFSYGFEESTIKYPDNPNGTESAIAGISDPNGRILGMMPHPERVIYDCQKYKNKYPVGLDIIKFFFN